MSSTNRSKSSTRSRAINNDYYVTPVDEIVKFLRIFFARHPQLPSKVLDPAAGGDDSHPMSYPAAFEKYLLHTVPIDTMDIRSDSLAFRKCNYLTTPCPGYDMIITNPPFLYAEQFIRKALKEVNPDGWVIFLLRLNFLGSKKRFQLFKEYPLFEVYVHHERISFVDSGETDSIEYAHFVWKQGDYGPCILNII